MRKNEVEISIKIHISACLASPPSALTFFILFTSPDGRSCENSYKILSIFLGLLEISSSVRDRFFLPLFASACVRCRHFTCYAKIPY